MNADAFFWFVLACVLSLLLSVDIGANRHPNAGTIGHRPNDRAGQTVEETK